MHPCLQLDDTSMVMKFSVYFSVMIHGLVGVFKVTIKRGFVTYNTQRYYTVRLSFGVLPWLPWLACAASARSSSFSS